MYRPSDFLSNMSFDEFYGLKDEDSSSIPVNQKRIDENKLGIIKINTTTEKKLEKDFQDLKMVQDFAAHNQAIWVAEFNHSCEYLATGCKDGYLKIWKVLGLDYLDEPYSLLDKEPY